MHAAGTRLMTWLVLQANQFLEHAVKIAGMIPMHSLWATSKHHRYLIL
jgi:hypothetical protein